jgi:3-oxoacyl-[acyl-carrier protein] reductase
VPQPAISLPSRGVLVTGASRGIGAAVATAFAARGDRVALHYRAARDRAEEVLAGLAGAGHVLVRADLGDHDAVPPMVAAAISALGRVDVLVNNAAVYDDDPAAADRRLGHRLADTPYEAWVAAWRRTVEVNLLGTANVTHCVVRHMIDTEPTDGVPRGRVVNVGSRGAFRGEPRVPAYGATKSGVQSLGQSLARDLGSAGIAVTSVAPGFVATDMAEATLAGPRGEEVRSQSPFGRVAEAAEVAAAVLYLASPEAEWASGAVLDLNGASYLR